MPATRTYEVVALPVPIVHDAHGDHDGDVDGAVFALARHEAALRGPGGTAGGRRELVRPLVLRARVGETVLVRFRNELRRRAGIHAQGVHYDVERADGGVVAVNPDSAAEPQGGLRTYAWDCEHEGVFFFADLADLRGGEHGAQAHGLYGALVVEPPGATWTDPSTGREAEDGPDVDVHVPGEPSFREYTLVLADGCPGGALANYRRTPLRGRVTAERHSSWRHGDPDTPVLRAYTGDRARIRLVHAGVGRTRVLHLHGHRWPAVAGAEHAPGVGAVGLGPQQACTIEPVGGAGATGDHLWEAGHDGPWGIWRVFDTAQDGTGRHPDGTVVPALRPLPGHAPPPLPSPERPGFPAFVPGSYPGPPPRPPLGGAGREPTAAERAAFCADPRPGETFTAVTPRDAPVRRYDVVALAGAADPRVPDGLLFALRAEVDDAGGAEAFAAALADGSRTASPLAIRARRGEVVEVSLRNALDPGAPCGLHADLVAYDPLVADGGAVGWNYASGATGAGPQVYRWYCDEELGTAVLTDPPGGPGRRRHGLYGCLVVEPEGAEWDTAAGSGTDAAVVTLPDGTAFREQVLALADGVPRAGQDPGLAVGYRAEPLRERPGDPADWFSSRVHGDPATPLLRAYPGEDIRIRLYQGALESDHGFVAHGLRWRTWPHDPAAPLRDQQALAPGEAFDLHVTPPRGPGDHLWSAASAAEVWLGAWGLVRVHDAPTADLPALSAAFRGAALPSRHGAAARHHHVRVAARPRRYSAARTDPYALTAAVDGELGGEPLVLRARVGEWVVLTLTNDLPGPPPASPFDPPYPGEDDPAARAVSERVSLHPGGLLYDVREADGAAVGENPDSTVKPGQSVVYHWYADAPGAVLLGDRADVRTHRRRGLVGVLVVEPADATPYDPSGAAPCWTGEQALVHRPGQPPVRELALVLSDGLRLYHDDDTTQPVCDLRATAGQKAFNHRSAHLVPARPSLADPHPPTPTVCCAPGDHVRLHLVVGTENPGHHGVTVHDHTWPAADHLDGAGHPRAGSVGRLTGGGVRQTDLVAGTPGDYAYRATDVRWSLTEGLWGLIRVR